MILVFFLPIAMNFIKALRSKIVLLLFFIFIFYFSMAFHSQMFLMGFFLHGYVK